MVLGTLLSPNKECEKMRKLRINAHWAGWLVAARFAGPGTVGISTAPASNLFDPKPLRGSGNVLITR